MELTLDGATLMAGLYPVGIIVAALEVRAMSGVARIRLKGGIYNRASAFMVVVLTFPAAIAIPALVSSVATGVTLKGWMVGAVGLSGMALWVAVFSLLIELAALARKLDTATGGVGTASNSDGESEKPKVDGRGLRTRRRKKSDKRPASDVDD